MDAMTRANGEAWDAIAKTHIDLFMCLLTVKLIRR